LTLLPFIAEYAQQCVMNIGLIAAEFLSSVSVFFLFYSLTRSQAVARIADRTASQHLWGSLDVIGHTETLDHMPYPIGGHLEPSYNGFRYSL